MPYVMIIHAKEKYDKEPKQENSQDGEADEEDNQHRAEVINHGASIAIPRAATWQLAF